MPKRKHLMEGSVGKGLEGLMGGCAWSFFVAFFLWGPSTSDNCRGYTNSGALAYLPQHGFCLSHLTLEPRHDAQAKERLVMPA